MKLIEKKCPNCGAGLEFSDTDKSCKCEYCKRTFEIERNETSDNNNETSDQFTLNELKTPLKIFGAYMAGTYIVAAIIVIISFIVFGLIFFSIAKSTNLFGLSHSYYSDVVQFSNADYGDFDDKAYWAIIDHDSTLLYQLQMGVTREKVYVLYDVNKKKNIVYTVYKAKYQKPFDNNSYLVYVPIKYEDLEKKSSALTFQLDNGKIEAPEFYLNDDHSEYTYGYKDINDFEKDVINTYSKNYKITKK